MKSYLILINSESISLHNIKQKTSATLLVWNSGHIDSLYVVNKLVSIVIQSTYSEKVKSNRRRCVLS